jgi:hypothetical protein
MEGATVESKHSSGHRAQQIDFPSLWFLARGAQMLVAVVFAKMIFLASGTDFFSSTLYSFIGLFLMICLFLRGIATGTADSDGIHYRLYFRFKTVHWGDVVELNWVGLKLRAVIKRGPRRKRVLVFLLNPLKSIPAYWAHRLGAEVLPPEILERIRALPMAMPPTMASAAPYSKWMLRIFLSVMAFFVLVVLWRLLSAASGGSH